MRITRRMFVGALGAVPVFGKDAAPIRTVEVFPVNYPVTAYFKFLPKPERPSVFVKVTCEDGSFGWGQSVPLPTWSYETLESATSALRSYLGPASVWKWMKERYAMYRMVSMLLLALPMFGQAAFTWKDLGEGRVELREGGKPALVYNYGPQWKQGAPEDRRRCCYVFPVYTPAGVSMLDDFPQDHWHHRGLFWSWPVVEVGGKKYDLWMTFTAKHRSVKAPVTNGGTLRTENIWEAGGKDIVKEGLRLTVLPARGNVREMDVELTWEALGAPVTLRGSAEAGKSYGGLSARFAAREGTTVRADGEVLSKDEDLTPRKWAELEGVYGGKRVALRITPDSKNSGAPYQWCLRAYGFVGASFPGRTAAVDGFTLEPGKPLTLKFRVQVRDVM